MKVLVAGATGFVGGNLVERLVEEGHEVLALHRGKGQVPEEAEEVVGDLQDYRSFSRSLEGVDAAYYLVHSMSDSPDFQEIERQSAENFREACTGHGVDRIIYLGGIIPEEGDISRHLSSRRAVGEILREGSADVTEFRAAIITGKGSSSFRMIKGLVENLPVIPAPRQLNSRCQPIYIGDVLHYLAGSLETPETRGEIFEIGGEKAYTYAEMLQVLADRQGRRLIVPVPFMPLGVAALIVSRVTGIEKSLCQALMESLRHDLTLKDERIEQYMPHEDLSFEEAVDRVSEEDS